MQTYVFSVPTLIFKHVKSGTRLTSDSQRRAGGATMRTYFPHVGRMRSRIEDIIILIVFLTSLFRLVSHVCLWRILHLIFNLVGFSFDSVRIFYNSSKTPENCTHSVLFFWIRHIVWWLPGSSTDRKILHTTEMVSSKLHLCPKVGVK